MSDWHEFLACEPVGWTGKECESLLMTAREPFSCWTGA